MNTEDYKSNTDVEIVKPGKKLHFICDTCECEFKVSKKYCTNKQTGLNEYNLAYNCPECGTECFYYA